MTLSTEMLTAGLALLFVLDAYYSAAETVMTSLTRGHIEKLIVAHPASRKTLSAWSDNPSRLLTTILVSSNLTVIGFSSLATALTLRLSQGVAYGHPMAAAVLVWMLSALVILCAEIAPKVVAKRHAVQMAPWILPGLRLTDRLLGPLIRVVVTLIYLITRPFARVDAPFEHHVSEEELRRTIDDSARGGAIENDEKKMIESVIEFGDLVVGDVMVPRTEMVGIESRTAVNKVLKVLTDCGYSRLPVYDGDFDNITGVLYTKDFLAILKDQDLIILQDVIRPAYYVPASKKITELLREFRRGKIHLAIVVDEYGGTAGLVTLEDLIEQIVGDIKDEYDHEPEQLRAQADGSWIADGSADIDEVNSRLGLELPATGGVNSLGGYLAQLWQKVPAKGERKEAGLARFTILEASQTKVERVRVDCLEGPVGRANENGGPHGTGSAA
jgi:putative hemolysin